MVKKRGIPGVGGGRSSTRRKRLAIARREGCGGCAYFDEGFPTVCRVLPPPFAKVAATDWCAEWTPSDATAEKYDVRSIHERGRAARREREAELAACSCAMCEAHRSGADG